ncbi:MAG: sugar phosphate isomerase/epimerase [Phycisphaerae bacterium]|nr:sugar phosphate isomerase/epimerase [Phycisphaerae bacterium]
MKKCNIGVCSWSLQSGIEEVSSAMEKLKIDHVHLAVRQGIDDPAYVNFARDNNWTISCAMLDFPREDYSSLETIKVSGGIVPDEHWAENQALFVGAAKITRELKVPFISMHAGFIDHHDVKGYKRFIERLTFLADCAAENGILLLLETGQESADDLKHFLEELDHPAVAINFDPANMVLYNKGNPIEALKTLAPWIKHVHIKDANLTETAGTWGTEVPWGDGQVNSDLFLVALEEIGYDGTLAIEREAGDNRFNDIALAVERLSSY